MSYLSENSFREVVKNTPLISLDLIVRDETNSYLLGKRINRPAKDCFFVPGGRVLKSESISDAFERLTELELGLAISLSKAKFLGVYQHLYSDSSFDADVGTHYVVMAYRLDVIKHDLVLRNSQHSHFEWFSRTDLLNQESVHINTKAYFKEHMLNEFNIPISVVSLTD